jgi:spermidine synthase
MIQEANIKTRREKIAWQLVLSVAAMGATSIVSQVILLREFLSVFHGNELIIGITLASWMILTAFGSYLGKYPQKSSHIHAILVITLILLSVLPALTVFLLRVLRNIIFPAGIMIGILQSCASSLVVLFPLCVVTGFSFTLFVRILSERYGSNFTAQIYSWESVGSFLGGLVFNVVLIGFLQTFQSLMVLMAFDLAVLFVVAMHFRSYTGKLAAVILTIIPLLIFMFPGMDNWTKTFLFKDQNVIYSCDTPYGNLTVTGQAEQKNFFENNTLLFSTNDPAVNEESIHYGMIQHPEPRNVLLISGGISGTTLEVLKYPVERVDYVELNPAIIEVGRNYTSALGNGKIHPIAQDARLYIKQSKTKYDVVLLNLPDPATAQINRYYTVEFFAELKNILAENAVVSISLLQNVDYYGTEARLLNSILVNTLKTSFKNIEVIPGSTRNYFLASDDRLSLDVASMIERKQINNVYVNRYYIDDVITRQRSEDITRNLITETMLNRDFTPVAYYHQLRFWLSYFSLNYWLIIGLGLTVVIIYILRLDTMSFGMFVGGFAASGIEIILLIAFQVMFGYVYRMMGVIISVFIAGLAAGALFRGNILSRASVGNFIKLQFGVAIYSILLPIILVMLQILSVGSAALHSIILLLTFIVAALIGMEFSIAAALKRASATVTASSLYGADLFGSAIGALIVSVYCIPQFGIMKVSFMLALVSAGAACISIINKRKYLDIL